MLFTLKKLYTEEFGYEVEPGEEAPWKEDYNILWLEIEKLGVQEQRESLDNLEVG